jgi:hypothetical protein
MIDDYDLQAVLEAFLSARQGGKDLLRPREVPELAPPLRAIGGVSRSRFDNLLERLSGEIDLARLVDEEEGWNRIA